MPETDHNKVIKYCPRCGSGDFPAVSNRSFKCGSCGFHYYINSAAAVAAIILNEKNEILFTIRAIEPYKGKLDLPGGFIDPGESAEEALTRELKEELGMEVESMKYFVTSPNTYVYSGFKVFTLDIAYIVKPMSLENLKPMDDISGYKFIKPGDVDFDELPAKSMQYFVNEIKNKNE